jgi:hypothetical protein
LFGQALHPCKVDSCFKNVPRLKKRLPRRLLDPLLNIRITSPEITLQHTNFITTPEGILYVLRALWERSLRYDLFEYADIVVDCPKMPRSQSQLLLLNEQILRPFDQIQLEKVTILGDIDTDLVVRLLDNIVLGPTSGTCAAVWSTSSKANIISRNSNIIPQYSIGIL